MHFKAPCRPRNTIWMCPRGQQLNKNFLGSNFRLLHHRLGLRHHLLTSVFVFRTQVQILMHVQQLRRMRLWSPTIFLILISPINSVATQTEVSVSHLPQCRFVLSTQTVFLVHAERRLRGWVLLLAPFLRTVYPLRRTLQSTSATFATR